MYTEGEVEKASETYEILDKRMKEVAESYFKIKHGNYISEIYGVTVDDGMVDVEGMTYSRCGCCSDDHESFSFPLSYLWNPNWEEELEAAELKRNFEAVKAQQAKEAEQKQKALEKERAQYLELKQKYEPEK